MYPGVCVVVESQVPGSKLSQYMLPLYNMTAIFSDLEMEEGKEK